LSNSKTTSFKLYVPFEFVYSCKFKKTKPILVYKSKPGDIYLSSRKTLDTLYGSVYIDDENHITFTETLYKALNIQKSDIRAIYVRRKRLYLDLLTKKI